ncbi:hypothetical protein [Lysinibacillus sp. NPDC096212]|uniref:hypothetical protein n=1 Tax=Lysinibacillus sp. NPDC096212 TaxID=3364135 RepID=UPI003802DA8A
MNSLIDRFNGIDIVVDALSGDMKNFYFLSKVVDMGHYKKYEIQCPVENEEEKSEYLKKINEITSKPDFISELAAFGENNPMPVERFEKIGYIECKYVINQIDIIIDFEGEIIKTFTFKDQDYLEDFMLFMEKEYRELVNNKLFN